MQVLTAGEVSGDQPSVVACVLAASTRNDAITPVTLTRFLRPATPRIYSICAEPPVIGAQDPEGTNVCVTYSNASSSSVCWLVSVPAM